MNIRDVAIAHAPAAAAAGARLKRAGRTSSAARTARAPAAPADVQPTSVLSCCRVHHPKQPGPLETMRVVSREFQMSEQQSLRRFKPNARTMNIDHHRHHHHHHHFHHHRHRHHHQSWTISEEVPTMCAPSLGCEDASQGVGRGAIVGVRPPLGGHVSSNVRVWMMV